MKKENNYYRQGDLGITPLPGLQNIGDIKKVAENTKEFILARGEATGHSHRLLDYQSGFDIFQDRSGNYILSLRNNTDLMHEEHKTITLIPGFYIVRQEREYDYFMEEIKKVQD